MKKLILSYFGGAALLVILAVAVLVAQEPQRFERGIQVVRGSIVANGAITSGHTTAGIGYSTGAGGTITQATDKSTGVTVNKPVMQITMNGAALAAAAEATFTVTNSAVGANDLVVCIHSSAGTSGSYLVGAGAMAAGSFAVTVSNVSAGSLSEAIVLTCTLLKGVAS